MLHQAPLPSLYPLQLVVVCRWRPMAAWYLAGQLTPEQLTVHWLTLILTSTPRQTSNTCTLEPAPMATMLTRLQWLSMTVVTQV